jgi:UDP-N-acetylglucosamine 3-dehydrogenase
MIQGRKVGVIGAGYWGRKHVEEYLRLGAAVTVADLLDENLRHCAENFGARTVRDYRALLADRTIESISVCTPNESHYRIAKECLEAGKHVLVEKPLCQTTAEGEDLIRTAASRRRTLAVGHLFRFHNAVNRARALLRAGELGDLFLARFAWTNLEKVFTTRDVLYDLGPHPFDLVDYLLGWSPDDLVCVGGAFRQERVLEAAFISCRVGEVLVQIELSWLTPGKERSLMLIGSRKTVFVDLSAQKLTLHDHAERTSQDVAVTPNNTIRDRLLEFLHAAERGDRSRADGEAGLKAVRLIELAGQSQRERRTLALGPDR